MKWLIWALKAALVAIAVCVILGAALAVGTVLSLWVPTWMPGLK